MNALKSNYILPSQPFNDFHFFFSFKSMVWKNDNQETSLSKKYFMRTNNNIKNSTIVGNLHLYVQHLNIN